MAHFNIDTQKITHYAEWLGLNIAWGTLTWAVFTSSISWVIGIIGGLTLVWFNVERALKARKERQMLDKSNTPSDED